MIIKSMARKTPSYRQLIDYMSDIDKSDEQYNVYQNLFSRKADDIEDEFLNNSKYTPKRKNSNYMYHEILSITKTHNISHQEQKHILRDIAYEYAQRRAKHNLIFGTLHDDHEEHLHYHLIISSNAIGESKKTRLSKAQFDKFKKNMENYVLEKYPELDQKLVINKRAGEKLSNKGYETKRRTGKVPQRELVKKTLESIFKQSITKDMFFKDLTKSNLELYVRGKSIGIKDLSSNRKHRLKTLGLMKEFNSLSERIKLSESPNKAKKESNDKTKTQSKTDTKSKTQKQKLKREKEMKNIRSKSTDNQSSKKHKK